MSSKQKESKELSETKIRNNYFKKYYATYNSLISNFSHDEFILFLEETINELLSNIEIVETTENRIKLEVQLDILKMFLEQTINYEDDENDYQPYPEFSDPIFNIKIFNKKEFKDQFMNKLSIDSFLKRPTEFKKSTVQRFVSNYISPNTPYNGILLWHGVGVGKTCAAISIAENFKNYGGGLNAKILILLPSKTLEGTWKSEIFNLNKHILNKNKNINVQCTGLTYLKEIELYDELTYEQKELRVNKIINKYYEILGYRSFANRVLRNISNFKDEKLKIEYIRKYYSNRIIIMDEVHETRQYANSNDDKDITLILELIARYGENNKFILATATPMYNSPSEIIGLLNLLLLNDKRAPLEENHIFKKDGFQLLDYTKSSEFLLKKSRGYISFLRGENPISFPIKIYPQIPLLTYTPSPKFIEKKGNIVEIDNDLLIKNMNFIKNEMSDWQYKFYKSVFESDDDEDDNLDRFSLKATHASSIVFPANKIITKDTTQLIGTQGDAGFDLSIQAVPQQKGFTKYKYNPIGIMKDKLPFLDKKHLKQFSIKFFNILNLIKSCDGIVFIYSRFLKPGVISFALMLEQNGYAKFNIGNNQQLLETKPLYRRCYCGKKEKKSIHNSKSEQFDHEFEQGKYIILTGLTDKKKLDKLILEQQGKGHNKTNNFNGNHIKVILGSEVVEKGVNFFNVREVHILEPWHHFNKIEQIAGRAIRRFSHIDLPPEKRNVSIYLHCATPPKKYNDFETTDERMYRRAYYKLDNIAKINRILKSNAVDCLLNKNGNQLTVDYFSETNPTTMITSQKLVDPNYLLGDKDNDIICDFSVCKYKCTVEPEKVEKVNMDTYEDILSLEDKSEAKQFLTILFINKSSYLINEILDLFEEKLPYIDKKFIYLALNDLIYFKETVYDHFKREGYLIYRNNNYIFQPIELDDIYNPFIHKTKPLNIKELKHSLVSLPIMKDDVITENLIKVKINDDEILENIINKINYAKTYINHTKTYGILQEAKGFYLPTNISKSVFYKDEIRVPILELLIQYYAFAIIDRLSFTEKKILLNNVLTKIITNNGKLNKDDFIEKMTLRFFDKKHLSDKRYSIFYTRRDLYPDREIKQDIPIVFRLINYEGDQIFFKFKKEINLFEETDFMEKTDFVEKFGLNISILEPTNIIYGFLNDKGDIKEHNKDYSDANIEFYIVNNQGHQIRYNNDGTIQNKGENTGATCGTATNATDKTELKALVVKLLGDVAKQPNNKTQIDFLHSKIKNNTFLETSNYKDVKKRSSLCEFIELLLRHWEFIQPDQKWFFTFEERIFYKRTKNKLKDDLESIKSNKPRKVRTKKSEKVALKK